MHNIAGDDDHDNDDEDEDNENNDKDCSHHHILKVMASVEVAGHLACFARCMRITTAACGAGLSSRAGSNAASLTRACRFSNTTWL